MKNIYGLTKEELIIALAQMNEKSFKATQIYEWLYQKQENDVANFSNLKKELREQLSQTFSFQHLTIIKHEQDVDTQKFLFLLEDQEKVEAVLMEHDYGRSICVSSQVGCNMGCAFCESGRLKKVRNLKAHEMVLQVLMIAQFIGAPIHSVVIMGIGEPLDNYDEVMKFIQIINDPKGLAIGSRHITLSTCGIIPKIKALSQLKLQINLAISLHAPNDTLRSQLMPINRAYPLKDLMKAVAEYIFVTHRRVTIEYILLRDVNDHEKEALELAMLLKGLNVYVNLIPYNETNHLEFKKSSKEKIDRFYQILKQEHINVTIRREFGSKISAACGQLRSKEL